MVAGLAIEVGSELMVPFPREYRRVAPRHPRLEIVTLANEAGERLNSADLAIGLATRLQFSDLEVGSLPTLLELAGHSVLEYGSPL